MTLRWACSYRFLCCSFSSAALKYATGGFDELPEAMGSLADPAGVTDRTGVDAPLCVGVLPPIGVGGANVVWAGGPLVDLIEGSYSGGALSGTGPAARPLDMPI